MCKPDIADGEDRGQQTFGVRFQLTRKQDDDRGQRTDGADEDQSRNDSADASFIEIRDAERSVAKIGGDDLRDQEAGENEEDIDADVSAGKRCDPQMTKQDRSDGDRPQTVEFRPVFQRLSRQVSYSLELPCYNADNPFILRTPPGPDQ